MVRSDRDRARELCAELDTIHLDRASAIGTLLPAFRELLEAESMLVLSPVEAVTGWIIERFEHDNFPRARDFERRFLRFFETAPRRYAWYDASRPERAQRNRVIDALELIPPSEYEPSRIYAEVIYPSGLHHHHQPRVLVCDGPSLLAWVGSFHSRPFDRRQRRLFASLVPSLQRRLRLERQLQTPRFALAPALDRLGAPAFVIGPRGRILEASQSGRVLFDSRRAEIAAALRDALAGRPNAAGFELAPIAEAGWPPCWLAIARAGSKDAHLAHAVAAASSRWKLTPRRHEVLELIVRGMATTTIAAQLGVTERAIELHVTALLDKAGVENRAALVGVVLSR